MIGWLIERLIDASNWLHSRGGSKDITKIEPVTLSVDNPRSPLELDDGAVERRIEDAMSLHDPDTYGYVLMTLKRPEHSDEGEISVSGFARPEWRQAFGETARRISEAASMEPVR